MWTHRALAAAIASLTLGGIASVTAAVRDDVERIEARRDRDDDGRAREARLSVPRTAAGAIDVPRLIVEIRAALTRGARDIRFRDTRLTGAEAKTLGELAERFGFERVRIREQGHRVRVDFHDAERDDRQRVELRREARDDARRPDRVEKAERAERADRGERHDRADRGDRGDRSGRH
jgi:transcription termination factor Rho